MLNSDYDVIIGSSGISSDLLKNEFPKLKHYDLPAYEIKYSKKNNFIFKILLQIPKFLSIVRKEYQILKRVIKIEKFDLIISDNRYGIYSEDIPSIFITHQVSPKLSVFLKLFESIIFKLHLKYLKRFKKCLIPDFRGNINLSGDLSHNLRLPDSYYFIGPLSQFRKYELNIKNKYDIMLIISGPEPQRSIFEKIAIKQIKRSGKKSLLVSGNPSYKESYREENIKIVSHLNRKEMNDAIISSEIIISRAGYTTIMDLMLLNRKAILLPTPGQTEQEYLAKYLKQYNMFVFCDQVNFKLSESIKTLNTLKEDFSLFKDAEFDKFIDIVKGAFVPGYIDDEKCLKPFK